MSRARDNIHSDRSREDIDRDQEAQRKAADLRLAMLYAADPVKYRQAMDEMFRLGMDAKVHERTRAGCLKDYTRNALQQVAPTPNVTINQGAVIDAAGLLRLVQSEGAGHTTGGGPGLSTPANPPAIPTRDLQDAHRLSEPVEQEGLHASEATDGLPERVRSEVVPEAAPPALRAPVPAETVGGRCPACRARTDDEPHECPVPKEV